MTTESISAEDSREWKVGGLDADKTAAAAREIAVWHTQRELAARLKGKTLEKEHPPLPADIVAQMRAVVSGIEAMLTTADAESHSFMPVHLAVDEAMSNSFLHGVKCDASKVIHVSCTVQAARERVHVCMCVQDPGEGFDPNHVPSPTDGDGLTNITGRGNLLINVYMDAVERNQSGNSVTMRKSLPRKTQVAEQAITA